MSGYLLAFASPQDGIAARAAMRGRCHCTTLPTPRAITASCGIAVLVPEAELAVARDILRGLALGAQRVTLYRAAGDGSYEPVPL